MPLFAAILFMLLAVAWLSTTFRNVRQSNEVQAQNSQALQALQKQLETQKAQLSDLEKRMSNVEAIVTDSKFVDPPVTGREAIDLQAEIRALKEQLNRR